MGIASWLRTRAVALPLWTRRLQSIRARERFRPDRCTPIADISSQIAALEAVLLFAMTSLHQTRFLAIGELPRPQQSTSADFVLSAPCAAAIACSPWLGDFVAVAPYIEAPVCKAQPRSNEVSVTEFVKIAMVFLPADRVSCC